MLPALPVLSAAACSMLQDETLSQLLKGVIPAFPCNELRKKSCQWAYH